MIEELELYKLFAQKIQEVNKENAYELRNIAEQIFLNSNGNKTINDLGFKILDIAYKLISYKIEDNGNIQSVKE